MNRRIWKYVVGLSILAGSLGLAIPAKATIWRNNDDSYGDLFLTLNTAPGVGHYYNYPRPFNGLTSQAWGENADPYASGYFRFFSGASTTTNQIVLDIRGGVPNIGARVQGYPPNGGGANQSWLPIFRFLDIHGAACYTIHSRADTGKVMVQDRFLQITLQNYNDPTNSPGQYWCAYATDTSGALVTQSPRPF